MFAAVSGMNHFGCANRCQISIALVADDDAVGMCPFNSCCYCSCAPVCRLDVARIEIVVSKYAASYRADDDGTIDDSEIFQCFSNKFMHISVATTRAVVGTLFIRIGIAEIFIIKCFRFYPCCFCHLFTSLSMLTIFDREFWFVQLIPRWWVRSHPSDRKNTPELSFPWPGVHPAPSGRYSSRPPGMPHRDRPVL